MATVDALTLSWLQAMWNAVDPPFDRASTCAPAARRGHVSLFVAGREHASLFVAGRGHVSFLANLDTLSTPNV